MKYVFSVDQYYTLISKRKEKLGRLKTNCTLTSASIERYISMNRFLYEEVESGIFFFSDEDTYYQAYYYLQSNVAFHLKKRNKPILVQNIYRERSENSFNFCLNAELERNGFILKDTLRHAVLENSDKLFLSLEKSMKSIRRVFEENGLLFQGIGLQQINELKTFMLHIDQIPFYQYPYYTDKEYVDESNAGKLSCVVDADEKIIAARHLIVAGKKAYGWVGIADKYKALYGIAPFILYKQLVYLRENNISMCSWVKATNIPSIHYHNRIGSVWTGQLEDEWLLECEEK